MNQIKDQPSYLSTKNYFEICQNVEFLINQSQFTDHRASIQNWTGIWVLPYLYIYILEKGIPRGIIGLNYLSKFYVLNELFD